MRSHFMPTGMALTEKTKRDQTETENGKYVDAQETSYVAGENVNC